MVDRVPGDTVYCPRVALQNNYRVFSRMVPYVHMVVWERREEGVCGTVHGRCLHGDS